MADPFGKIGEKDKIIEIETITDRQIEILMGECYRENKQDALEKILCFILHGSLNEATISGSTEVPLGEDNVNVEASFLSTDKTIYIYYNPSGNKIQISS